MSSPTGGRIAAAQYDIGFFSHWSDYAAKIGRWVAEAGAEGAELLVFPEYFSMELASLFPPEIHRSLARQLETLQSVLDDFIDLFAGLAASHAVTIAAGTFPVRQDDGTYRNRAILVHPDGRLDTQDKLQMTRFEDEQWLISPGDRVTISSSVSGLGPVGVSICYDVEFPLLTRRQVEDGAKVILVPSCTDTTAGYWRVRIGAQARALENQCYVIQSSTVGVAPWSEAVDVNIGAAGVYTPIDRGFPEDGVLVSGELNRPGWVFADLDLDAIDEIRRSGQVLNHRDWTAQHRFA